MKLVTTQRQRHAKIQYILQARLTPFMFQYRICWRLFSRANIAEAKECNCKAGGVVAVHDRIHLQKLYRKENGWLKSVQHSARESDGCYTMECKYHQGEDQIISDK